MATSEDSGAVVCPNISPRERRKRLYPGLAVLGIGLIMFAVLVGIGADRGWRLLLVLPFWGAASGIFQWRDETWVGLAARGARIINDAEEQIEDASELAQVRRQARRVQLKSLVAALLLTLVALLLF